MDDGFFNLNIIDPRLDASPQAAIIEPNSTIVGLSNEAQTVITLNVLGETHLRAGRPEEAQELLLKALKIREHKTHGSLGLWPKLDATAIRENDAALREAQDNFDDARVMRLKGAAKGEMLCGNYNCPKRRKSDAAIAWSAIALYIPATPKTFAYTITAGRVQRRGGEAKIIAMLLYLLERDAEGGLGSVEIGGNHWRLAAFDLDASDVQDLPFICVSYTWGEGREPSPFHPSFDVSDQRAHTLESMGYIYSRASEVIVVLSNAARSVLEQMRTSDRLDSIHLDVLEREKWVSRAWTYQEAVNSRNLFITCEDPYGAIVEGSHFLNSLGNTLSRLGGSGFASDKRQRYPRLDVFQDLIADSMIAEYQERSALQVMSNMDRRTQRHREDHFYAMIGAISTARASSCETSDPCEAFMRSSVHLTLALLRGGPAGSQGIGVLIPGPDDATREPFNGQGREGEKFVEEWLESSEIRDVDSPEFVQESMHAALQFMGFKGSPDCISTTHGLFFPYERISADEETIILVATQVRWTFGAPGIARCYGNAELYTPGVFIGLIDNAVVTSVKMS
ncbi:hypothetical protein DL767_004751 [Monosporascus sp. MG133]|nr:hypothetical protein DL767_004751 [Monosporascus sp. MG133]